MRTDTSQAEAEQAAGYQRDFVEAVMAGGDKLLPVFQMRGPAKFYPVSELLGDPHKSAQALLLRACRASENGETVMALSLLKAYTLEMAREFGVNTAEAVVLIADCGRDERRAA